MARLSEVRKNERGIWQTVLGARRTSMNVTLNREKIRYIQVEKTEKAEAKIRNRKALGADGILRQW